MSWRSKASASSLYLALISFDYSFSRRHCKPYQYHSFRGCWPQHDVCLRFVWTILLWLNLFFFQVYPYVPIFYLFLKTKCVWVYWSGIPTPWDIWSMDLFFCCCFVSSFYFSATHLPDCGAPGRVSSGIVTVQELFGIL